MAIPETQVTLLGRLRDPADEQAWRTFEGRYRELIVRFSIRQGLQFADAEDIAQRVLVSLLRVMRTFEFDPKKGRFRDYLFRVIRNAVAAQNSKAQRPTDPANALLIGDKRVIDGVCAATVETDQDFEDEWKQHHFRLAMTTIRETHSAESLLIFDRLLCGESVVETAARFATTTEAVHKVKQRIRIRMKELIARQISDEGL